jgi:hypothetical protein
MPNRKGRGALLLALALTLIASAAAYAQDSDPDAPRQGAPSRPEVNHEVHVHLLATSDDAEGGVRVPQSLEPVVRQLKAALPPADYRLAATFINRVRDNAGFDVKTAGAGPSAPAQTPSHLTPSFIQLTLGGVKLIDPASAQPTLNVNQFRLGMKVPINTANVSRDQGEGAYPVIQYEDAGLYTQFSVREGEPTLVGTLNSGRPGQLFVVVVTLRRGGKSTVGKR